MLKNDLSKIREMQRVGFIQYIKKKLGGEGSVMSLNVISVLQA